jgi:predicted transcriptional regulator YdeE
MSTSSYLSPPFTIIGIETRTTNAEEMSGNGRIAQLWGRFFQEGIREKIPNKKNEAFFALYTDYESDRNGAYTVVLGMPVTSSENVPEGLSLKTIPAASYHTYTSEVGPLANVAFSTWQRVWEDETAGTLHRAYTTDYEVYDHRASDPQKTQMDVCIAVS